MQCFIHFFCGTDLSSLLAVTVNNSSYVNPLQTTISWGTIREGS